MSSWLATGEGASQGLEEVLHRMIMEQAQQQQLTEQGRHNLADEGLMGRRIDEQSADRRLREQERSDSQAALNKNREEANILRRVALRPIGADVTPEEKAGEVSHGIPFGNYKFVPANMGMDTATGESKGPTPDSLTWRGTQDQITKAAAAGKHGEDKGTIHDTPEGLARLFSDGTTEPVLDENGKRVQGYHAPQHEPNPQPQIFVGPDGKQHAVQFVGGKAVEIPLPDTNYRKPNATMDNRLASAKTVSDVGNDLIKKLSDPAYAAVLGPVMGRYSKVQDFIGNPPPEYSELAGAIESYALANMGVHGMRSAQGAQLIANLLQQPHTPESMAAAIRGLNGFSEKFIRNTGQSPTQTPQTDMFQEYLNRPRR